LLPLRTRRRETASLPRKQPLHAPPTRAATPHHGTQNIVSYDEHVSLIPDSVRRPDDFQSYLLLSTSSRVPLLTFWTASYCSTCKAVSPVLQELIESGVGEEQGGIAFCEIEYDCPDIMQSGLGMTYMITSMPTLLSFNRGEAQTGTKVTNPKMMRDREWLREWIKTEARRGGNGGGGQGPIGSGLLGGLFGGTK
jgi:thiol-disulfide isomerase/thioredoxin